MVSLSFMILQIQDSLYLAIEIPSYKSCMVFLCNKQTDNKDFHIHSVHCKLRMKYIIEEIVHLLVP